MPRILSISRNQRLLALRNDALALAGYKVASPREPNEAVLLLSQERFDAVVVGHSVEPEIRRILIPAVRNLRPNDCLCIQGARKRRGAARGLEHRPDGWPNAVGVGTR